MGVQFLARLLLGYLAYDSAEKEAFIPNKEIMEEFENAMSTVGWDEVMRVLNASENLLRDTLNCREESVAQALDKAHTEVASVMTYHNENSPACAIWLAFYFLPGAVAWGVVEWNVLARNIKNTPVKEEGSSLKSEQELLSKGDIVHRRCKNSGKCAKKHFGGGKSCNLNMAY